MTGIAFKKGTLLILTGPVPHFHIVMNDPVFSGEHGKDTVLVVNISSVKPHTYHDPSCVLHPGCHAFVRHPSWVVYEGATVMDTARIDEKVASLDITTHEPASDDLFEQVRLGFDCSPHLKPKIRRYLKIHNI
jgi:hypothetical protein